MKKENKENKELKIVIDFLINNLIKKDYKKRKTNNKFRTTKK
jgi:hypothetical protein